MSFSYPFFTAVSVYSVIWNVQKHHGEGSSTLLVASCSLTPLRHLGGSSCYGIGLDETIHLQAACGLAIRNWSKQPPNVTYPDYTANSIFAGSNRKGYEMNPASISIKNENSNTPCSHNVWIEGTFFVAPMSISFMFSRFLDPKAVSSSAMSPRSYGPAMLSHLLQLLVTTQYCYLQVLACP